MIRAARKTVIQEQLRVNMKREWLRGKKGPGNMLLVVYEWEEKL